MRIVFMLKKNGIERMGIIKDAIFENHSLERKFITQESKMRKIVALKNETKEFPEPKSTYTFSGYSRNFSLSLC